MKHIIKTFGFISLIAAVSGANGAASRVSMVQTAARRLPSVAGWIVSNGTSTATTTSSSASTFTDTECIDAYTGCLKGADVCGPNMEECTTNVLLHAKMPNCLSTLYQCSSNGINSLFGTSSVTALSNVQTQNSYGEVTRYTYPTDGSVLGQMVIGAHLSNLLPTDQCVKKYTNCLKRDNVCGADFELCTTDSEFKKQSLNCASTLARCQSDGLIELFGSTNTSVYMAGSRIRTAIDEGAALAAVNAVATCYKVADQCILGACAANPTRCIVDSSAVLAEIGEAIADGSIVPADRLSSIASTITSRDIAGYLKNACLDTIGGNKYCYATFLGNGQMPTNAQLQDEDNRAEIFDEAYSARMNNAMKQKIQDLLDKFDKRTKNKCVETIKSCAMRNCGSGIGSVCYSQVFGSTSTEKHINGANTYGEIQYGCEAITNTDANCQYAAASVNNNTYTYTYTDNSVFTTLFPEYSVGFTDPISVVATLDALLSSSYNDAAIAQMKKQCQTVALGCVRSMCGKDFTNCYRNRTDIISGTYNTDSAKFNRSMNKMGGVLDYNVVIGLCLNTVKSSSTCEEHLKIAAAEWLHDQDTTSWSNGNSQYSSVREAWRDANTTGVDLNAGKNVLIGCAISVEEAQAKEDCVAYDRAEPINGKCDGVMDEDGCIYSEPVYQNQSEYTITNAAKSLFQQLLVDVETEAQAKYNAKLTAEQNMCYANNNGGIKGTTDSGSTFQWVKLKTAKIPKNYASKGLLAKQFTTSNDLYGSFCRARITVMSDDKDIQDNLGADAVAYFAVGDPFTCGSWISRSTLDKISKVVGDRARKKAGEDSRKDEVERRWWTIGSSVLAGLGTYAGVDSLQRNGKSLGGLLNSDNKYVQTEDQKTAAANCSKEVDAAYNIWSEHFDDANISTRADYYNQAVNYANRALRYARTINGFSSDSSVSKISFARADYTDGVAGKNTYGWNKTNQKLIQDGADALIKSTNPVCNATCQSYLNLVLNELKKSLPDEYTINNVKRYYDLAINNCANGVESTRNACLMVAGVGESTSVTFDNLVDSQLGVGAKDARYTFYNKDFDNNLNALRKFCDNKQNANEGSSRWGRFGVNAGAGVVAAGLTALTVYNIVDDAQKVKYENAENEAIDEWMEDVGSHISCYLGSEELGTYGDVISFELD